MDDDWDIMNELEAEENGLPPPKKQAEEVQVADSQLVVMPLGPDRAPESESEEEVALGRGSLVKPLWLVCSPVMSPAPTGMWGLKLILVWV